MEIRIALKEVGSLGFSNKLKMLSKGILLRYQPVTIHTCLNPRFLPSRYLTRDTSALRHLLGHFFELLILWNVPCLKQLYVERYTLEFFNKDVERFWQTGFQSVLPFHNRFIHAGTSNHVVGLHSQHFLQGACRTIGFESPYLHLTQALSTKLGFAPQRLLRHQGVRTSRTGMDLVVHEMMQFHHINLTN